MNKGLFEWTAVLKVEIFAKFVPMGSTQSFDINFLVFNIIHLSLRVFPVNFFDAIVMSFRDEFNFEYP